MNPYNDNFVEFFKQDMKDVGTKEYKGYGCFWNMKYKHDLRDTTPNIRRKIHKQLLKANLDLDGKTPKHDEIINRQMKTKEHTERMQHRFGTIGSFYSQDESYDEYLKEISSEISKSGLQSVVIDENTDFNSPEFVELGKRMQGG